MTTNMPSELYRNMYHLEKNIYCNHEMVICRLYKLVIIFLRSQSTLEFYLLKRTRESNISNSILTLMNMENPEPILQKLIGSKLPEPLSCRVDENEIKLIPQALGCYDILFTFETKQSLLSKNVFESKPCIVYLNDFINNQTFDFFQILVSSKSPNKFACDNLFRQYMNISVVIPRRYMILLSLNSLHENARFLSENTSREISIFIVHKDMLCKPTFPTMNCIVIYLNNDRHLVEPLLPVLKTDKLYIHVKNMDTLQNFYK